MFQEIITYTVLLVIAGILLNKGYNFFKKPANHCQGCYAAKSGCKLAEIKKTSKAGK
jgi:hypothetical protein